MVEAATTRDPEVAPLIETQQEAEVVPAPAEIPVTVETPLGESEAEPVVTEQAIPDNSEADVATPVAPQTPHVAPEAALAKNKATWARKAPKAATNASVPRAESKTSQVIAMLKREGGTTLEEIMTAMNWQQHTTRAMMSAGGSLTKKHGLVVTSEKVGDQRRYSIKA
jgi:Protein of unknown function (DUF3489)